MRKLLVFAAVIIVVLIIGGAASRVVLQRANTNRDVPIFAPVYVLDTPKPDDLFVFADEVYLSPNSSVAANASIVGRTRVVVNAQIDGDLTVMGGDINFGPGAKINGDVILIGNQVTVSGQVTGNFHVIAQDLIIDENAQLTGNTNLCASHMTIDNSNNTLGTRQCGADELAGWQSLREGSLATKAVSGTGFSVAGFVFTGILALAFAAFSGLIVTIFPRGFGQMTQAIRTLPVRVSRVGCLTQILTVFVVGLLGVIIAVLPPLGLILLPILALLMLPLGIVWVIGWMTMGLLSGDWLLRRFAHRSSPPMLTMIVGSLALFLVWTVAASLPFGPVLGSIMVLLTGAVGLGAAIMTRLGTRSPARSYFVQG